MTLEELYYVSQIAAAVAIFGSLVFVGLQMRAQTRESRLSAIHELSAEYRAMMAPVVDNPELRRAWIKSLSEEGWDALVVEEQMMLGGLAQQYLRTFESLFIQQREGRLDDDMWQAIKAQLGAFMSTAVFREFWRVRSHYFTPRFGELIASLPAVAYPGILKPGAEVGRESTL